MSFTRPLTDIVNNFDQFFPSILPSVDDRAPHFEIGGPSNGLHAGHCRFPCTIIAGNAGVGLLLNTTNTVESPRD